MYMLRPSSVLAAGDICADSVTRQSFYDQLTVLPTSEAIFLLTTFANMAQCRPDSELDFIEVVTAEIFEVDFMAYKSHILYYYQLC